MTQDERDTLEAKADRAMRRGELSTALKLLTQLCAAFPGDATLHGKRANLQENLQPMELTSAKSRFVPDPSAPRPGGGAPLDEAEAFAARGEYGEAIARYRKALADKPDSVLLKERLTELFVLSQAQAPRRSPPVAPKSPELHLSELLDRIAMRRKP